MLEAVRQLFGECLEMVAGYSVLYGLPQRTLMHRERGLL